MDPINKQFFNPYSYNKRNLIVSYLNVCTAFWTPESPTLGIDDALQLLEALGCPITQQEDVVALASSFSIPFRHFQGRLFFDRNELIDWCMCKGYSIPLLEQELTRSFIEGTIFVYYGDVDHPVSGQIDHWAC